jgi:uncharacterized protein (DUF58 family)
MIVLQKNRLVFAICFAVASIVIFFNAFGLVMLLLWAFSLLLLALFAFAFIAKNTIMQVPIVKVFVKKAKQNGLTEYEAVVRGMKCCLGLIILIPLLANWART